MVFDKYSTDYLVHYKNHFFLNLVFILPAFEDIGFVQLIDRPTTYNKQISVLRGGLKLYKNMLISMWVL